MQLLISGCTGAYPFPLFFPGREHTFHDQRSTLSHTMR